MSACTTVGSPAPNRHAGHGRSVQESLGILAAGVIFMMFFHVLAFQTTLYFTCTRKNPFIHLRGMGRAAALAFGSSSSAVTLPTNMLCCEALGYDPAITRFCLSLGATISMDGTAMYYGPIIMWLAYQAGLTLDFGQVIALSVISTLSSMGAAPTPGAGTALMVVIWESLYPEEPLPSEFVYYLAIDWLMDRFRTCTNVIGDSYVTAIVDHITKKESAKANLKLEEKPTMEPLGKLEDEVEQYELSPMELIGDVFHSRASSRHSSQTNPNAHRRNNTGKKEDKKSKGSNGHGSLHDRATQGMA